MNISEQQIKPRRRWGWLRWLLGVVIVLGIAFLWLFMQITGARLAGFGSLQMAAARYTPKDVIGDLGGMPVTIPAHMAEFVEYEGDPGWGESREGPVPERTHASRLFSFGVTFRYPDMATLSSPDMWKDKESKNIYNTDWMHFGVTTGSHYLGNNFLEYRMQTTIEDGDGKYLYVKLPEKEYGMEKYVLDGIAPKTGRPNREVVSMATDRFFAKDGDGKVIAEIRCSTVSDVSALCSQTYSMETSQVNAQVDIQYRRAFLKHWPDIQQKVTNIILGFRASAPESSTLQSVPAK